MQTPIRTPHSTLTPTLTPTPSYRYSFGIVLWELATRETPWPEISCADVGDFDAAEVLRTLNHALQTGQRPAIPQHVVADHSAFVAVMERCWQGDPVDRPTFSVVVRDLAACMRSDAYL
jgi:hypothetical protein